MSGYDYDTFFEGNEGDIEAQEQLDNENITDYKMEWDYFKKGYRVYFNY